MPMICSCPHCDALVPMNPELALHFNSQQQLCPCCELPFNPFVSMENEADLKLEELKDKMAIDKSLQNLGRLFDDC